MLETRLSKRVGHLESYRVTFLGNSPQIIFFRQFFRWLLPSIPLVQERGLIELKTLELLLQPSELLQTLPQSKEQTELSHRNLPKYSIG